MSLGGVHVIVSNDWPVTIHYIQYGHEQHNILLLSSSVKNGLKLSLLSANCKIKYTLRVKRFVKWASGKEMRMRIYNP
jgi:hypothetical protein